MSSELEQWTMGFELYMEERNYDDGDSTGMIAVYVTMLPTSLQAVSTEE